MVCEGETSSLFPPANQLVEIPGQDPGISLSEGAGQAVVMYQKDISECGKLPVLMLSHDCTFMGHCEIGACARLGSYQACLTDKKKDGPPGAAVLPVRRHLARQPKERQSIRGERKSIRHLKQVDGTRGMA